MTDHEAPAVRPSGDDEHRPPSKGGSLVVGLGASAGGLAALKAFFATVPPESGVSFVVVVHLSAEHESHLADLLQPHAPIPVQQVTERTRLEPNHVYVIPPGRNLGTLDSHLSLEPLEHARGDRAPVDHFFRALAETHDGSSVAVVLSGTGSDGALGIRHVREAGGMTVVQDPDEAEFDGMPRSALDTGMVDRVLPIARMMESILEFVATRPEIVVREDGKEEAEDPRDPADPADPLHSVLTLVRLRTGHDFLRYKRTTVARRVARRMQLLHLEHLEEYVGVLRADADEAAALLDDLLINVTSFFRDREVFATLESEIVPRLFEGRGRGDAVRVWSVGCATGEEAYSLGMLLLDEAARHASAPHVQIFATDLHEPSLQKGREALYPETIETEIPSERLERYFRRESGGYRVTKQLRDAVVFATHNLLRDPPFSRIDLVVCRNVLIYLQRDVQDEVVDVFHYSLSPGGYLLLGTAETLDRGELFRLESKDAHLYRRRDQHRGGLRLPALPLSAPPRRPHPAAGELLPAPLPAQGYGPLHLRMLERYAPPSLLVSRDHHVVHLSQRVGRYLQHPGGEPTSNLFQMVREELRMELRTALHSLRERRAAWRSRPIAVRLDGEPRLVVVRVSPADEPELEGFALVIFDEVDGTLAGTPVEPAVADENALELEAELEATRSRMQALIEEFETSQEEMRASNEELQSANEELRSTMEELETSREELQSVNEELQTVNQENRHKVEELSQLSSDLQNLLQANDVATLFLDRNLRILRYTPRVSEVFNIRHTDRGRPLADLTHRLGYGDLMEDARHVLRSLVPIERDVPGSAEDSWYLLRISPYRTVEDHIDGVVITLVDVTALKRAEETQRRAEERQAYLLKLADALRPLAAPVEVQATAARVLGEHLGSDRAYYVEINEAAGEFVVARDWHRPGAPSHARRYPLGDWPMPWLVDGRTWVVRDTDTDPAMPHDQRDSYRGNDIGAAVVVPLIKDGRLAATFATNQRRPRDWTAHEIALVEETAQRTWAAVEQARAEEALRQSEEKYRALFNEMDEAYAVVEVLVDEAGRWSDFRFLDANPAFLEHSGMPYPVGRTATELLGTPNPRWAELYGRVAETGEPLRVEESEMTLGRIFDLNIFRLDGPGSRRVAVLFTNITERRRAEVALRESEERLRRVLEGMGEGFGLLAPDFTILEHNREALRMDGRPREEIVGRSHWEVYPGSEDSELGAFLRRAMAERVPVSLEHRYAWEEGRARWLEMRAYPTDDGSLAVFWRDVTERRGAQAALRQSEEKYRTLFETMDEGFVTAEVVYDEQGRAVDALYLEGNPAASRLTGVPDYSRRLLSEAVPDAERYWLEIYDRVARTGVSERLDRFLGPHAKWYEFFVSRVVEADEEAGTPARIAVLFQDVTDRKQVEAALRQSEERQAFLLQLSDRLRVEADPRTIASIAMHRLADHLNLDRAYVAEVDKGRDRAEIGPEYRRAGFAPVEGVLTLSDFPEAWRRVEAATLVLSDTAGDPTLTRSDKAGFSALRMGALMVASAREGTDNPVWSVLVATEAPRQWTPGEVALVEETAERTWAAIERARAEGALRESEERYRTLFETMGQGYSDLELLRDPDGRVVDQRWVTLNPAFERIFGIPVERAVGRRRSEIFPGLEPWWQEAFDRVARSGVPERVEYETPSIGGWYEMWVYPRGGDRLTVLYEDITERKRAEAVLRESEERQAFLLKLSDILQQLEAPADVKTAAMRMLGAHLGVSRAQYHEVDESGEYYSADGIGYADGLPLLDLKYRIDQFGGFVAEDFEAGRPFRSDDLLADPRPTAEEREAYRFYGIRAGAGIPLLRGGKLVAILAVHDASPHPWTDLEMELIRETAERVWVAVEKVRTGVALRESEARMQRALAIETVGVLFFDLESNFLDANDAFLRMAGADRAALERGELSSARVTLPGWMPRTWEAFEELRETGRFRPYEKQLVRPDGTRWWGLFAGTRLGENECIEFVLDVTARREAEEALRASEARQAFLLTLSDALRPLDSSAEIQGEATRLLREHLAAGWCYYVEWDEAAARGVVLRDATRAGLPSLAGTHDVSDVPAFLDTLRRDSMLNVRDYAGFEGLSPELRARYTALGFRSMLVATLVKQGRLVASLLVGDTEVRDWSGDAEALLMEVAERTWAAVERARAELGVRESEEQFRRAIEEAPIPVIMHAEDGEVLQVSRTWTDLTGYTLEEVPTFDTWLTRAYGHGAESVRGHVHALFSGSQRTMSLDFPVRTRGGELRHWSFSASAPGTLGDGRRFVVGMALDVTERRRAEEALRQSEERLRHFGEASSDVIWMRDADTMRMEYVSPAFEAIYGVGRETVLDRGLESWAERVVPEDRDLAVAALERVRAGERVTTEYRVRRPDGEIRWLRDTDFPIPDAEGRIARIGGIGQDVTEEMLREGSQALLADISADLSRLSTEDEIIRTVGARLAAHLKLACYHYVDVDEERGEVTVSHFWHALDVPSIVGTYPIEGFVTPEGLEARRAGATSVVHDVRRDLPAGAAEASSLRSGADAQKIRAYVAVPYSQDGRWRAYFAAADSHPRRWTAAEVELVQEVASRIFPRIERVRADAALRESEEKYRTLFERMDEGFALCELVRDADGRVVDYRYVDLNPALVGHGGITPDALRGRRATEFYPDLDPWLIDTYARVVATGESVLDEHYFPHVGRWLRINAFPRGGDRFAVLFGDVTERRRAEEARRESEARLQFALEAAELGTWELDLTSDRSAVRSPRHDQIFGYSEPQAEWGQAIAERHVLPEDVPAFRAAFARAAETGLLDFEVRVRWPDGSVHWIAQRGRTYYDAAGRPVRMAGVVADVTERQHVEEARRESDRRQAFLLHLSDTLRTQSDERSIRELTVRMLAEQLRLDRCWLAEVLEREDVAMVGPDHHRPDLAPAAGVYRLSDYPAIMRQIATEPLSVEDAAEDPRFAEAERVLLAGLHIQALLVAPLRKEPQQVVSALVAATATPRRWTDSERLLVEEVAERAWLAVERVRAEAALRESEARYRLIVEGARDYAILTTDMEGRITGWSPGAHTVYGWSGEKAIGELVDMTFTPEDREAGVPLKEREQARAEGVAPDVRWHLCSDGTRVFIDGVNRLLRDPGGEVRGFLKIGQDVTRRREMEETLRELNETLERRVEERTEALTRAIEERRQVLQQLVTAEEEERRRISRELHDHFGQQLTGLLLGLSAAAGEADPAARLEDLRRLADTIARDIQSMAVELRPPALDNLGLRLALQGHLEEWSARHRIGASYHSSGLEEVRLPREVETTLCRVVQEGLTNVLKHAGATHVSLLLERRGGAVHAILEDDGRGFDVDETLASPEKAKRLGLRGMRERVALVGGEMEIESSPGVGTTLFVRVPDADAATRSQELA